MIVMNEYNIAKQLEWDLLNIPSITQQYKNSCRWEKKIERNEQIEEEMFLERGGDFKNLVSKK